MFETHKIKLEFDAKSSNVVMETKITVLMHFHDVIRFVQFFDDSFFFVIVRRIFSFNDRQQGISRRRKRTYIILIKSVIH